MDAARPLSEWQERPTLRVLILNLSNLTNQRVYQELVHRNKPFKEMITGSAALPLPSFLPFYFHVRAFSMGKFCIPGGLRRVLVSRARAVNAGHS